MRTVLQSGTDARAALQDPRGFSATVVLPSHKETVR